MDITVLRYSGSRESTLSLILLDGIFQCYGLEDEHRTVKVFGETRIPAGQYEVILRTEGGHHARYSKKFPDIHKGMLHIQDVPNFKWILIHIGNDGDDTAGCLLTGNTANNNKTDKGFIGRSKRAYKKLYTKVIEAMNRGEQITITYLDEEFILSAINPLIIS